ncbi:MAG: hypothetical protein UX31_C0006G0014 [Candidatus Nomurabacteria bacterium GW2011_GWA1_46_11]|uniref:Uncharacterized protein n=2 Tax=Parcubacteria group TaxID=1794811 RepID=A0A1G1YVG5_9BACT|nr:MAG: hypothetical protein UX29_C0004G0024 [Parcubacteria group bacterium GW2011_GWA2_46_10]KKU22102.1 MAG: hypothetical protein UX31_C0006G0014 [Candidatus Nomurabacteria bacterium GW2011_GWA1_46_11]OGY56365.1 MAG: hypothetical protein A2119_02475 [Candidatus Colwellbacteria bacterium GWA2_46_10]
MNLLKENWFKATLIILSVVVVLVLLLTLASNAHTTITTKDGQDSLREILPLYFYSYPYEEENGPYSIECPQTKDIDWQLAIYALSAHIQFEAPEEDYGPAEIQRNFDENCERNMHIYETLLPRLRAENGET